MAAIRTFISVNLDAALHDSIDTLIKKLSASNAGVKWVAPDNVHLTLKFLGNIEERRLPEIYAACERAVAEAEPIELDVCAMGCFPNMNRPRVVWVGIEKGAEALHQLQRRLEDELDKIGFPREDRKFKAHLTIGRVKKQKGISRLCQLIEEEREIALGSMRAEKISVMKSKTLPTGPIYTELRTVPL
jgi:2'-5' RNA ligase